jgi:hypothetical protein
MSSRITPDRAGKFDLLDLKTGYLAAIDSNIMQRKRQHYITGEPLFYWEVFEMKDTRTTAEKRAARYARKAREEARRQPPQQTRLLP